MTVLPELSVPTPLPRSLSSPPAERTQLSIDPVELYEATKMSEYPFDVTVSGVNIPKSAKSPTT